MRFVLGEFGCFIVAAAAVDVAVFAEKVHDSDYG